MIKITKRILVGNSELWLIFEEMILYRFLKQLIESRFKFVGNVSYNLEATYTTINLPELVLTFSQWKLPLEAYMVLYLCRLETVLRKS